MTSDKYDLPTSSLWILGLTALVAVLAIVIAFAQALGALATECPKTAPTEADSLPRSVDAHLRSVAAPAKAHARI